MSDEKEKIARGSLAPAYCDAETRSDDRFSTAALIARAKRLEAEFLALFMQAAWNPRPGQNPEMRARTALYRGQQLAFITDLELGPERPLKERKEGARALDLSEDLLREAKYLLRPDEPPKCN